MKALITGVTGQDGQYLREFLESKGYEVLGLARRVSDRLQPDNTVSVDITDAVALQRVIDGFRPDEVYNLAAMSHVGESFKQPGYCYQVNAVGALNVLEASRNVGAKVYQASTSELFGTSAPPQNEKTPFHPRSPYGVAKLAAYWQTVNYREAYGMYACNGILFNHESPRRGADFVTQKVVRAAAKRQKVKLGNLEARRDWGHAKDYVRAMWLMLQQPKPDDYVVATKESHSVKQLCELAYRLAGLDWKDYVETDDSLKRPAEVDFLLGDPRKITEIGWKREYDFETMIREMFAYALHAAH